jgi:hypothetical protein
MRSVQFCTFGADRRKRGGKPRRTPRYAFKKAEERTNSGCEAGDQKQRRQSAERVQETLDIQKVSTSRRIYIQNPREGFDETGGGLYGTAINLDLNADKMIHFLDRFVRRLTTPLNFARFADRAGLGGGSRSTGLDAFCSGNWSRRTTFSSALLTRMRPL